MQRANKHYISVLVLFLLCVLGVGSSDSGPDKIGAFVMSQGFTEKHLKAPSTADFCSYSDATVTDLGGGRFRVSAYVDAENSFGAKIRTIYTCVLKSTDGKTWTLESLDM
jgi:hypothetical protein